MILARDEQKIGVLLASHPEIDFYVPSRWVALDGGVHEAREAAPGCAFLLRRTL